MFEKVKTKITKMSKDTVKEELQKHASEIFQGATIALLLYLAIKVNSKPINITVNVNGGHYF